MLGASSDELSFSAEISRRHLRIFSLVAGKNFHLIETLSAAIGTRSATCHPTDSLKMDSPIHLRVASQRSIRNLPAKTIRATRDTLESRLTKQ